MASKELLTDAPPDAAGARRGLLFNIARVFPGNLVYTATQWGLLIVLTKFFSPAEFGVYALALAISTPLFTASSLQLRYVYIAAEREQVGFENYLFLRLASDLAALLALLALYALDLYSAALLPMVLLLGANQFILNLKDAHQGVLQRQERMDLFASSRVIQGLVTLGAAAAAALLSGNMLLVVATMLAARLGALLLYDLPQARRALAAARVSYIDRAGFSLARVGGLFRTALPLGVVAIFLSLNTNVPRYFLAQSGTEVVGYFAAVASLKVIMDIFISSLGESASRRLALAFTTSRAQYVRLLLGLIAVGVAFGAAGLAFALLFGELFLALFFRPEYRVFAPVFVWLMGLRVISNASSFLGYGLTAARQYGVQVWIVGLGLLSLLVASWLLIPRWAGLGAAWAMFISELITLAAMSFVMVRTLRTEPVAE